MSIVPEVNAEYTSIRHRRQSQSNQSLRQILIPFATLTSLLLIATIVLTILYLIERNSVDCNQTTQVNSDHLCLTPYCIKTANDILDNIDETVDPCENFYQFTCGSWLKRIKLSKNKNFETSVNKLVTAMNVAIVDVLSSSSSNDTIEAKAVINARRFYNVCVDHMMTNKNKRAIHAQILNKTKFKTNTSKLNLSELFLEFNQYNTFPFYKVKTMVNLDSLNTPKYCIRIGPASLYVDDDETDEDTEFGFTYQTSKPMHTSMSNFTTEITSYLSLLDTPYSIDDVVTTVKNLTNTINTTFDFSTYIRRLYHLANITLIDNDTVIIYQIENIRNLSLILAKQSPDIIQNYMIKRFFKSNVFHFSKTSNSNQQESVETKCADYINNHMSFAVGKLYIDKYFDADTRRQSIEIVENIREAFIDMVKQSTWTDEISKKRTIEKAKAIVGKIGYPDFLKSHNLTQLETMYAEYNFGLSYLKNVLLLRQLNVKRNLQKLRQNINHDEWILFSPTTMNVFYNTDLNEIVFPASFLQPPFFHKDAPNYLNYGGIGSVIGHEITHGFDELRRYFDKDGMNLTLWSNETENIYDQRSKCLIDQYNNYTVSQINVRINGSRTIDENIADNDGLRKAFNAYQKWKKTQKTIEKKLPGLEKYTAEQMFFISFGQVSCSKMSDDFAQGMVQIDSHSPFEFRIIGSTSNFDQFDRAFNCKPGQNNSRVNKCKVW